MFSDENSAYKELNQQKVKSIQMPCSKYSQFFQMKSLPTIRKEAVQWGKGKAHQHGWAKGKVHCQVTKQILINSEYVLEWEPQYALEKLAIPNSENLQFHILNSAKYSFTKQD